MNPIRNSHHEVTVRVTTASAGGQHHDYGSVPPLFPKEQAAQLEERVCIY